MSKSGIVNVRMVITEEKILSNIDKIQKLINPKSKKQIIELEEDTYFKDLIESVKTYLLEYPKKKNFPSSVYKAAYGLVEFATNQFEDNTKRIETLIRQREENIALAGELKEVMDAAIERDPDWKELLRDSSQNLTEDIIETIKTIARETDDTSEDYQNAIKILNARINNLESNLHIEIDMERIEDRSKALSYIGIEIADALRTIPTPVDEIKEDIAQQQVEVTNQVIGTTNQVIEPQPVSQVIDAPQVQTVVNQQIPNIPVQPQIQAQQQVIDNQQIQRQQQLDQFQAEQAQYEQETRMDVKPSLWQRIKNSKIGRAVSYIMKIRIVIDVPSNALPEGRGENY